MPSPRSGHPSLAIAGIRASRALGTALLVTLALVTAIGDADAQRRRGRRGRGAAAGTDTSAPAGGADAATAAPPDDPFGAAASTDGAAATPPPAARVEGSDGAGASGASAGGSAPLGVPPPSAASRPAVVDPGPLPPDLGPLRSDWSSLMDDMVSARQRVATLGEELFHTRLGITVQDRAGDDVNLTRFALELDGTPIYHADGAIEGGDAGAHVWDGALAPGPHELTIELTQEARDGEEYRYSQRDTFRFIVVRDRRTEITVVLEDDSDIARAFASGGEGRYDVRTRVRVATRALE